MLFDRLCRLAETGAFSRGAFKELGLKDSLRELLEKTALFHFPYTFHKLCPPGSPELNKLIEDGNTFWDENFFLPMPIMSMEDTCTSVLLVDLTPESKGLSEFRFYLDFAGMGKKYVEGYDPRKAFERFGIIRDQTPIGKDDEFAIGWGIMRAIPEGKQFKLEVQPGGGAFYYSDRNEVVNLNDEPGDLGKVLGLESGSNAMVSFQEIMWFNSPNRFVVETRPAKEKIRAKSPKIARSQERPIYTLITKDEIKALGFRETQNGGTKSPHWVRRHWRTLKHEKYARSGKQFQSIIIPAYWSGPTELKSPNGKKVYKICIDL